MVPVPNHGPEFKQAMEKMRREHNRIAVTLLPEVKVVINAWALTLRWLEVTYVVTHDRLDVVFRPTLAEYLVQEQLELISIQRRLLQEFLPECRVKRGRIAGAKKMEDDCWMVFPKG